MQVRIFISDDDERRPRVAFVSPVSTESVLPAEARWYFVRTADTAEFSLPTAIDDEIRRCGFWVYLFGSGTTRPERPRPVLEPLFG